MSGTSDVTLASEGSSVHRPIDDVAARETPPVANRSGAAATEIRPFLCEVWQVLVGPYERNGSCALGADSALKVTRV